METNFSHLPPEVLSHILSFLDIHQRLTAGLVCKSWLQASNSREVLEDVSIPVCSHTRFQQLLKTTRRFLNLKIYCMEMNDEFIDILSHLGSHLLHLYFQDCRASASLSRVAVCPNLISLEVDGDADILLHISPLPHLRRLNLRRTSSLTDMIFTLLDAIVGFNLETFSISNEVVWDPKVCDTVESFIKKRAKTLTNLEFINPITKEAAVRLSKIGGLSLVHASFLECEQYYEGVLPEFCSNQLFLVSIDVTGVHILTDEDIIGVCQVLPNLQRFVARLCQQLDTCVPFLFRLKHLREVDLESCNRITPASFTAAVDTFASQELQYLRLGNTQVQDAHLDSLLKHVPHLKCLYLEFCFGISKRKNVTALFEQLPKLQELRICMQKENNEEILGKGKALEFKGCRRSHVYLFTRDTVMK